jgi:hypothetical protein
LNTEHAGCLGLGQNFDVAASNSLGHRDILLINQTKPQLLGH